MNTGQTVYEQLQEILNKCIELGYRNLFFDMYHRFECEKGSIRNGEYYEDKEDYSYHELFSKDSGIMEFVEWKVRDGISNKRRRNTIILLQYRSMSSLTAEEKCSYFVKNAIIPTK